MTETHNYQQTSRLYQDGSVVKYRLDTTATIRRLEMALKGYIVDRYIDEKNNVIEKVNKMSEPRVNEDGQQAILAKFSMIVNPQGLQAYFDKPEEYNRYITKVWSDFSTMIMVNRRKWEIDIRDYDVIIDSIMNCVKLGLSGAIKGKYMDSISNSTTIQESTSQNSDGGFTLFRRRT